MRHTKAKTWFARRCAASKMHRAPRKERLFVLAGFFLALELLGALVWRRARAHRARA